MLELKVSSNRKVTRSVISSSSLLLGLSDRIGSRLHYTLERKKRPSLKLPQVCCHQKTKWRLIASITFNDRAVFMPVIRLSERRNETPHYESLEGKLSPLAVPRALSERWTGNPPLASSLPSSLSWSKAAAALWITIHVLLALCCSEWRRRRRLRRQNLWNPSKTRETLRPSPANTSTQTHSHQHLPVIQPLRAT